MCISHWIVHGLVCPLARRFDRTKWHEVLKFCVFHGIPQLYSRWPYALFPHEPSIPPGVWLVSARPRPPQPAALCGRGSRAWQGRAPWRADGQGANRAETGKNLDWWRSRAPFASCTLKKDATRTLPHARCVTPMRFHRVPRASAPSHHVVHGQRHHPQLLLAVAACVRVSTAALSAAQRESITEYICTEFAPIPATYCHEL